MTTIEQIRQLYKDSIAEREERLIGDIINSVVVAAKRGEDSITIKAISNEQTSLLQSRGFTVEHFSSTEYDFRNEQYSVPKTKISFI